MMTRWLSSLAFGMAVVALSSGASARSLDVPALAEQAGLGGASIAMIELNRGHETTHQASRRVFADRLAALPILVAVLEATKSGWQPEPPYGPTVVPWPAAHRLDVLMRETAAGEARARGVLAEALGARRLAAALAALGAADSRFTADGRFETTAIDMARGLVKLARAEVVGPEASDEVLRLLVLARRAMGPVQTFALIERHGMHAALVVLADAPVAAAPRVEHLTKALWEEARVRSGRDWARLPMRRVPSHNHSDRQGARIDTIVLHHTVIGPAVDEVATYFRRSDIEASAHYIVGKDGTIVQAVDDCRKAWHACVSTFQGRSGVNAFSIGIEIVNRGDGRDPYPEAQYRALARLVLALQREYGVPWARVTGHRDIALPKGRKVDPSDNFSYARLKAEVDRLRAADPD